MLLTLHAPLLFGVFCICLPAQDAAQASLNMLSPAPPKWLSISLMYACRLKVAASWPGSTHTQVTTCAGGTGLGGGGRGLGGRGGG